MVQALSFAEMLAGGLLLVAAYKNATLGEVITDGLHGISLPARKAASSAGAPEGRAGEAGTVGGLAPSPKAAGTLPLSTLTPMGKPFAEGGIKHADEILAEKYLGRPLTAREKAEL